MVESGLLFSRHVSVTTHLGRHIYTVPPEKAQALLDCNAARVSGMRRKCVWQLALLPNGLAMIGAATGSVLGGAVFAVQEHLTDGIERTGRRVYRHRDEIILRYPDAFVDVVRGVGARVAEDPDHDRRRTCLASDQGALNATRE
jgi:hypothetical protein